MPVDVVKYVDTESLHPSPRVALSIDGRGGVDISLETLEQLGAGNVEAGLMRVAGAISTVDYAELRPGDTDPLYEHFIWPETGGGPEVPS